MANAKATGREASDKVLAADGRDIVSDGGTAHEPVPPMRWMLPLEKSMGGCLAGRPVHQVPEGWMPLSTRFSFLANTQDDQGADMELMKPMVR